MQDTQNATQDTQNAMSTVSGHTAINSDGKIVTADSRGNNTAIVCSCGHPVLITVWNNQKGSSEDKPATCKGCGTPYWAIKSDLPNVFVIKGAA